ncbi:hypothetical protein ACIF6H_32470 [Streptomyces microflavus]|uniref:hypothetical protein n=1 Tax=Streptomyces microflavus TaxID=1919 RepID=UPI0037D01A17
MTTRITFSNDRPPLDVPDDLADALHDALTGARAVAPPNETAFDRLIALISRQSRVLTHLALSREVAVAAADATGPHANRRAIGAAAAMAPSQLGDVLERNGRPRSRKDGTVLYDWILNRQGTSVETGSVRAADEDQAAEFAMRDAKVRQVGDSDDTGEPFDLVVRRRGRSTGPDSWTHYDPAVLAVLPDRNAAPTKT